jgi:hypothetical protein
MGQIASMLGLADGAQTKKLREGCSLNATQIETFKMETAFDELTILKYYHVSAYTIYLL